MGIERREISFSKKGGGGGCGSYKGCRATEVKLSTRDDFSFLTRKGSTHAGMCRN